MKNLIKFFNIVLIFVHSIAFAADYDGDKKVDELSSHGGSVSSTTVVLIPDPVDVDIITTATFQELVTAVLGTSYDTGTEISNLFAAKLSITDIDDTPVDAETNAPISSNWAYDHINAADPHSGYVLESDIGTTVLAPTGDGSGLSGIVTSESDPNALLTAGIDNVKDTHVDWGTGVGQVSADDIPDGSTNIIPTSTQETNWDNHLSNTSNPHSVTPAQVGECSNSQGVLPTTSGITDGYVPKKQTDGSVAWEADSTGAGGDQLVDIVTTSPITVNGGANVNDALPGSDADITFAISDAVADGSTKGAASFAAADFNATSGNISIDYTNGQTAGTGVKGFLTGTDWDTFNGKQDALSLGTGVETALGIAIGSVGSPIVNGGVLGTPTSGNGSNLTNVNAATVTSTDSGDVSATWYLAIFDGATGTQAVQTDAGLWYNPSTNTLGVGALSIAATASPYDYLMDSDAPDTDKTIGGMWGQYISGIAGAEESTISLGPIDGGTITEYIQLDAPNTDIEFKVPVASFDLANIDTTIERVSAGVVSIEGVNIAMVAGNIGAAAATTPSADDNDTSVATTAYVQTELTAYASDTATLTNKTYNTASTGNTFTGPLNGALDGAITDPADADDMIYKKVENAMTLTDIHCLAEGGGTVTITLQECTSAGASCSDIEGAITCDSDGAEDDGTLTDSAIAAGAWIKVNFGAPSGTVNNVAWTVYGTQSW